VPAVEIQIGGSMREGNESGSSGMDVPLMNCYEEESYHDNEADDTEDGE
jgi:hypothetical protein